MKPPRLALLLPCLVLAAVGIAQPAEAPAGALGAWRLAGATEERVMIITESYWTQAIYRREQPEFIRTFGGPYSVDGDTVTATYHFDSGDPQNVGQTFEVRTEVVGDEFRIHSADGPPEVWRRIDAGEGALAGAWRITSRQVDGQMQDMPLRARRTLKVLSGTRFQWIAMNIETGEFSGTGGGTYTLADGKYIEHIAFFSRDSSRVGTELTFEADVSGDTWRHRGLSSRGGPIDETWTRLAP